MSIRRLVFSDFGNPDDVLRMETVGAVPSPESTEVLARSLMVPINPADLNYIEGVYGRRPELPACPGTEGVVRILDPNKSPYLKAGQLAIVNEFIGTWLEEITVPVGSVIPVPETIAPEQLAMLKVNPPTALLLLRKFVDLEPGDWILQNAANSAVGQCVIQLARARGLHTLNFVRREESAAALRDLGADAVLIDGHESAAAGAREILADAKPRLALNAVGGESALRLMDLLGPGGVHVTYGAMSRRSLKVPNRFLIFDDLQIRGFWVSRWMEQSSKEEVRDVYRELSHLMAHGELHMDVEKVYPVEEFQQAIAHARRDSRHGKVLMRFGDGD